MSSKRPKCALPFGTCGFPSALYSKFRRTSKATHPTDKYVPFVCTEAKTAFDSLKSVLLEKPILQFPDLSKPFIAAANASNEATGSVLCQIYYPLPK